MQLVTSRQMREIDRRTIEDFGVHGDVLMERAGMGTARIVARLADANPIATPGVLLVAGRGNNGGDAFVAARCLSEWGYDVEVRLAGKADAIKGDALEHFKRMLAAGVELHELPDEAAWKSPDRPGTPGARVLVDGILGTGISGPARGTAAAAIRFVNTLGRMNQVVAIDVPSGLNADTGEAPGDTVCADVTVTMALPKVGLVQPCALDFAGNVEVIDIGIPSSLVDEVTSGEELITRADLYALVPPRPRQAHKGCYGHVLIIGGGAGFTGAAAMAAAGAVRSGAGLVSALVPAGIAGAVAATVPEAMVHPAPETEQGTLRADCLDALGGTLDAYDAVVVGPGLTSCDASASLVRRVLKESRVPLLLDADALNVCAGSPELIATCGAPTIITPHPGEMARLMGWSTDDVQVDRFGCARKVAVATGSVVVLKGAGTVVTQEGRMLQVNLTGNPGMASGGMGDVLSGVIAALLARGCAVYDAARLGVWLHGRAADRVCERSSQAGLTAMDVIDEIPVTYRELSAR